MMFGRIYRRLKRGYVTTVGTPLARGRARSLGARVVGALPTPPEPVPAEHAMRLNLAEGVKHPSVKLDGAFGDNSVLTIDRRIPARMKIHIRVSAPTPPTNVRLQIGHVKTGRISIAVAGSNVDMQIGHTNRLIAQIGVGQNSLVRVGDRTTSSGIEISCMDGIVRIGSDCQSGGGSMVMGAAHHGIVALRKGRARIVRQKPEVHVGDHVWLGFRSYVGGRARIGSGCIVAACSSVVSPMPPDCLIAGNPAAIRRRNVGWSRDAKSIDEHSQHYFKSVVWQSS
ncbi:hypothetical protein [Paracoccus aerodenitrificans]|uniref:hypothetical protein n=1 Tax=Paracoccus aerodenitrificans TaxID=3017781 RepID=UPI0022F0557C|nr:hypothetical protein [Paracoccus aerodenitrificans]WBU63124.1 hypothetical protein PAE61_12230 [Paracoccus aerodenitrificans]